MSHTRPISHRQETLGEMLSSARLAYAAATIRLPPHAEAKVALCWESRAESGKKEPPSAAENCCAVDEVALSSAPILGMTSC